MESHYSIGCFSGFHVEHSRTFIAILITSIPFKVYGTLESLLLQAAHNSVIVFVHVSPANVLTGKEATSCPDSFPSAAPQVLLFYTMTDKKISIRLF